MLFPISPSDEKTAIYQGKTNAMDSVQQQPSPQENNLSRLKIVKVEGRSALNDFIGLLWPLYQDDPMWVPPLILERRSLLAPNNPYFEHATYNSWIAYRDGKPVGRISAQIDQLHLDRYQDATGFFGMLEAENNPAVFKLLMETAENWLRQKGMRRVAGPYNLSINQEVGLLVDGFDTPPVMMMGHARPYYAERVEENGYRKEKDLLAYIVDSDFAHPHAMQALTARAKKRVQIRSLRKSDFKKELAIIRDVFNDAWSQNWGFIPWTNAEFEHLGKDLKMLVDEDLAHIAQVDGEPAAFMIVLPNINEAIRDLNGRLLPFGWLKLLWRLKVKRTETARVPLMGVRCQYHDTLLGAALAFSVIADLQQGLIKRGMRELELSWILEDNKGMRNIIEAISGRVYKTYRIYSKEL